MMHSNKSVKELVLLLASSVLKFKEDHCEEVADKGSCHELDLMSEAAQRVLQEYNAVDSNLGDA